MWVNELVIRNVVMLVIYYALSSLLACLLKLQMSCNDDSSWMSDAVAAVINHSPHCRVAVVENVTLIFVPPNTIFSVPFQQPSI